MNALLIFITVASTIVSVFLLYKTETYKQKLGIAEQASLWFQKETERIVQEKEISEETKQKLTEYIKQLEIDHEEDKKKSLSSSRATLRGQAIEHLAPYMMESISPKDLRFVGNPIDYLAIEGISAVLDGQPTEVWINMLEIKSGSSSLNKSQRAIRDAVISGRVKFSIYNSDNKTYKEYKYETKCEESTD